ncbi:MAG: ankyrin repeat domain-containing protein [Acetatifactor sp.]|nr:ankyrin repeat domain-containing protein [Acetatifactor sp.]
MSKRDESGNTPLIYVCMKNARDLVKLLSDNGADLNAVDNEQHSALHYAADAGYTKIVEQKEAEALA